MSEVLLLLAGMFLGYVLGHRKVNHTIKVDARDAIKQLKEATKAAEELQDKIKW